MVPENFENADLLEHIAYLKDPTGMLSIDQIKTQKGFIPSSKGEYVPSHTKDTVWMRMQIKNLVREDSEFYLVQLSGESPFFDVYIDKEGETSYLGDFGYKTPFSSRKNAFFQPLVKLDIKKGETATIYIKAKFQRIFSLCFDLLSFESRLKHEVYHWCFIMAYTGLFLGLILYNLFLYLRLKDAAYIAYVCYASNMLLTVLTVTGIFEALDIGFSDWHLRELGRPFMSLLPMTALLFTKVFLKIENLSKPLSKALDVFCGYQLLQFLAVVYSPNESWKIFFDISNLIAFSIIIYAGFLSLKSGFTPAKYYLVAWGVFLCAVFYWTLGQTNIIPLTHMNAHASTFGSALEMILMSLALAERIKLIEKENLESMVKAKEGEVSQKMVRVLCHDIANPLAVVQGSVDICRQLNSSENLVPHLKRIERAENTIRDIIESVRKFESAAAKGGSVLVEAVSIKEVMDHAHFIFEEKLAKKELSLVVEMDNAKKDLRVLADKVTLSNDVINNLISNAIKFSFRGKTIKVIAKSYDEKYAVISIQDEGVGMDEAMVKDIYAGEVGVSRKGTEKEKGTGFGMPLVKSYVESYGGSVEIYSKENEGTKISIYLKAA